MKWFLRLQTSVTVSSWSGEEFIGSFLLLNLCSSPGPIRVGIITKDTEDILMNLDVSAKPLS